MDAVTPKDDKQIGVEGHSHIVRPAEMDWKPTSSTNSPTTRYW